MLVVVKKGIQNRSRRFVIKEGLICPLDIIKFIEGDKVVKSARVKDMIQDSPDLLITFLWSNKKFRIDKRQFHELIKQLEIRFPDLAEMDKRRRFLSGRRLRKI